MVDRSFKSKERVFLIVLILLGLIFSALNLAPRLNYDARSKNILIAIDYDNVFFVNPKGKISESFIEYLYKEGLVNSVAFNEIKAEDFLLKPLDYLRFYLDNEEIERLKQKNFNSFLLVGNENCSRIETYLRALGYEDIRIRSFSEGNSLLLLPLEYHEAKNITLGFEKASNSKLKDILTPLFVFNSNDFSNPRLLFDYFKLTGFDGEKILIFKNDITESTKGYFQKYISKEKARISLIDFSNTPIVSEIISEKPHIGIRTAFFQYDYKNYGKSQNVDYLIEGMEIAVRDRNVRALIIYGVFENKKELIDLLKDLNRSISSMGFRLGNLSEPTFKVNSYILIPMVIAIASAVTLLITLVVKRKTIILLTFISSATLFIGLYFYNETLLRLLAALLSSIVFPILALIKFGPDEKPMALKNAIIRFVLVCLTSTIGGIFIFSFLATHEFALHARLFRGVKLTYLIPILGYFAYQLIFSIGSHTANFEKLKEKLKGYLDLNIKVKSLLIFAVFSLIIFIYIERSGNTELFVSDLELKIRYLLSKYLIARPRTKEFLIGHPLLLFSLSLGIRQPLLRILSLFSIVGQISIVNTFSHAYTPIWVSLLRTFNGMLLGLIIFLVVKVLVDRLSRL